MAAKKKSSTKLRDWMLEAIDMSDEETGRWLIERIATSLEQASVASYLLRDPERKRIRGIYLDQAVGPSNTLYCLAHVLALDGDFSRAGKAWRRFVTPLAKAHFGREFARHKMRATKLKKQLANEKRWSKAGLRIRESERGVLKTNYELAKAIARETGGNVNTIRLRIPEWDLDKVAWRKRSQKRVKSGASKNRHLRSRRIKSL